MHGGSKATCLSVVLCHGLQSWARGGNLLDQSSALVRSREQSAAVDAAISWCSVCRAAPCSWVDYLTAVKQPPALGTALLMILIKTDAASDLTRMDEEAGWLRSPSPVAHYHYSEGVCVRARPGGVTHGFTTTTEDDLPSRLAPELERALARVVHLLVKWSDDGKAQREGRLRESAPGGVEQLRMRR